MHVVQRPLTPIYSLTHVLYQRVDHRPLFCELVNSWSALYLCVHLPPNLQQQDVDGCLKVLRSVFTSFSEDTHSVFLSARTTMSISGVQCTLTCRQSSCMSKCLSLVVSKLWSVCLVTPCVGQELLHMTQHMALLVLVKCQSQSGVL